LSSTSPWLPTPALTYLHSKHIAHCDLSLENVVIRPSDLRLCILDFGLCVATNGAGHSEELLLRPPHGKAKYQAPEVRLSQRERSRAKAARAWGRACLGCARLGCARLGCAGCAQAFVWKAAGCVYCCSFGPSTPD
jgi:serine/threonine protein kinase